MENLAIVITAILGSTGIASLLNSSSIWGRRTKLFASIKRMSEHVGSTELPSTAREAYEASITVQSLELASLNLVKLRPGAIWMLGAALSSVVLLIVGTAFTPFFASYGGQNSLWLPSLELNLALFFCAYFVWYIFTLVALTQALLARKRHRFVAAAWNAKNATPELILEHSSYLKIPAKPEKVKNKIGKFLEGLRSKRQQDSSNDGN